MRFFKICVIQLCIILFFAYVWNSYSPVYESELQSATVKIEEVEYEYLMFTRETYSFTSNSEKYSFPKFPVLGTGEYSAGKLYKTARVGDVLEVEYIQAEDRNIVIGAKKDGEVLRSVEEYNKNIKQQRTLTIITGSVIEVIFIAVLIFIKLFLT